MRRLDEAESQVRRNESRLSEEDIVPADTTAIQKLRDQLGVRDTLSLLWPATEKCCETVWTLTFFLHRLVSLLSLSRSGRLSLQSRRTSSSLCSQKYIEPKRWALSSAGSTQTAAPSWSATRREPIRWQRGGVESRDRWRHGEQDAVKMRENRRRRINYYYILIVGIEPVFSM